MKNQLFREKYILSPFPWQQIWPKLVICERQGKKRVFYVSSRFSTLQTLLCKGTKAGSIQGCWTLSFDRRKIFFWWEYAGILVQNPPNSVFVSFKKYSHHGHLKANVPISTMLIFREERSLFCVMVRLTGFDSIFGYATAFLGHLKTKNGPGQILTLIIPGPFLCALGVWNSPWQTCKVFVWHIHKLTAKPSYLAARATSLMGSSK